MPATLLIVEDETSIAETIQYPLEAEGYTTHWVSTGEAALARVGQGVDLLILDVGLPDINGFELLKQIRLQSSVPVIFLTARSDEIDRVVGLEIGADDYVTKPFSPRELVARVKAILKRVPPASTSRADSDFEVDEGRAVIRFQMQLLTLTRAEYRLLLTLLEQPGRVFERNQLISSVWGSNHPSDDRVIDTHIKEIRAKLRQIDANANPIKTHRGLGYSLEG